MSLIRRPDPVVAFYRERVRVARRRYEAALHDFDAIGSTPGVDRTTVVRRAFAALAAGRDYVDAVDRLERA